VNKFYPLILVNKRRLVRNFNFTFYCGCSYSSRIKEVIHHALCQSLGRIGHSNTFYSIDQLVHLILTLPISIATTKRSFSTMKIIKSRLCERMKDEFLVHNMVIYIEKEIAENFSYD